MAVQNASKDVREVSDFVAPSHDEDGISVALEAVIFDDANALDQMRVHNIK